MKKINDVTLKSKQPWPHHSVEHSFCQDLIFSVVHFFSLLSLLRFAGMLVLVLNQWNLQNDLNHRHILGGPQLSLIQLIIKHLTKTLMAFWGA